MVISFIQQRKKNPNKIITNHKNVSVYISLFYHKRTQLTANEENQKAKNEKLSTISRLITHIIFRRISLYSLLQN